MKTKLLGLLAASALVLGAASAPAANVSVSVFYDSLEPYGEWMDTDDYGYVWHPRGVDRDWRPYTVGNWAYTDAGWTWVSEEPFGWATYHYGRWVEIERVGWTWVPDREWGPAWVSWRRSDRHVGWAPLPPEARFEARTGFSGWVDSYYDIGPTYYSFVRVRDFGAPRLRTVILEPRENITIISETRNITNITYVNNVIVNNGPDYDVVARESAQPIRRLKLDRRTDIDYRVGGDRQRFAAEVRGDTLRVAAPEMEINREIAPKKLGKKLDRVEVDRGWKNAGDPKAVEQLRAKVASETKAPAELPPTPKLRGSDRPERGERPQAATPETSPRPGAPTTADAPQRDMKPGAEKPATIATGEEKPRAERPKAGTTAESGTPVTTESPVAGGKKAKTRTPEVAETAPVREEDKPAKVARDKRAKEKAPTTATAPTPDAERPSAIAPERMPKRPEARDLDHPVAPPTPAEPRPEKEKPKKAVRPEPVNPPREADRPEAARPERAKRPEPAAERPERKGAPPAATEQREPMRKAPPAREDRSPERARPEAAERSPENRPPAPAAPAPEAPKKGGKPDKGDPAAKDDKKKD